MKRHFLLRFPAVLAASVLVLGISAQAAVIEGFETFVPTQNTNVKGDASVQGVYFSISPTELTHQLLLTTIDGADNPPIPPVSANPATTIVNLNTFFGVPAGTIKNNLGTNGTEGSGFRETFSFNAGDQVSFNYDFLTQEANTSGRDFAFMILLDSGGNVVQYNVLATSSNAVFSTGGGNTFATETHYQNFAFNILASGNFTLCLGVVDTGNAGNDTDPSALLVDNISVNAIPEPSTVGLSIAGAALLVALRRRIKGKNS